MCKLFIHHLSSLVVRLAGLKCISLCAGHDFCSWVVTFSGHYDLKVGLEDRLGNNFMERIRKEWFIELKTKSGIAHHFRPYI